jgi:hypothetical protein
MTPKLFNQFREHDTNETCHSEAADQKCSQQKTEDLVGERMAGKLERVVEV